MEYSNTVVDVWFIERERQLNTQKLQTTLSTFKCTWADQPLAKTLLLLMFNHHPDKTFPLHKRMNTSLESYCLPFHFGSPACFFILPSSNRMLAVFVHEYNRIFVHI